MISNLVPNTHDLRKVLYYLNFLKKSELEASMKEKIIKETERLLVKLLLDLEDSFAQQTKEVRRERKVST
jgi:hypothetical protein